MTDQTNWDTQPMSGWRAFEVARARFHLQRQPRTVPTPDLHAEHDQGAGGWEHEASGPRRFFNNESRQAPANEE